MHLKIVLLFSLLYASSGLFAHTRSESFSVLHLNDHGLSGAFTFPMRETTRVPYSIENGKDFDSQFASYLASHLIVRSNDSDCEAKNAPKRIKSDPAYFRLEISFECGNSPPNSIVYTGLFEFSPSHLHYSRLYYENGDLSEYLFQSKRTEWNFETESSSENPAVYGSGFLQFLLAGMEHIAGGFDHIAFLLALLLVARNGKDILVSVTGFTIGHSLTLSLAVLGKIKPDSSIIEAFIGLTIWIVAGEFIASGREGNRKPISLTVGLLPILIGFSSWFFGLREAHAFLAYLGMGIFAFCHFSLHPFLTKKKGEGIFLGITTVSFGMIHGFGFAGFLLETGLEKEDLVSPLFGFNLGVEFGQLFFVAVILLLREFGNRFLRFRNHSEKAGIVSMIILFLLSALGMYWFVQRSFVI